MTSGTFMRATSAEEAVAAMRSGATPVAGGTDLVVGVRQGKRPFPDAVVAIDGIGGLDQMSWEDGRLVVGALTTHEALSSDPRVRVEFPALADASAIVGSHATRAQGTVGGNVMNASPAMDTGAALLCFDAEAELLGPNGARTLPLAELWTAPGRTSASSDELLVAVNLARQPASTGSAYVRLQYRRHMEIAVAGVAALLTIEGGVITRARVAVSAMAPTILRVPAAEEALEGSREDAPALAAAASALEEAASPISDVRGSARYRVAMATVLLERAVSVARSRAHGIDVPVPASDATFGGHHGV